MAPLRQSSRRERDQYQASPVSMVLARASAFMWATMRTSPVSASVVTQVTSPSAPKRGMRTAPSSTSEAEEGGGNGECWFMTRSPKTSTPDIAAGQPGSCAHGWSSSPF